MSASYGKGEKGVAQQKAAAAKGAKKKKRRKRKERKDRAQGTKVRKARKARQREKRRGEARDSWEARERMDPRCFFFSRGRNEGERLDAAAIIFYSFVRRVHRQRRVCGRIQSEREKGRGAAPRRAPSRSLLRRGDDPEKVDSSARRFRLALRA